jgi:4-diphosphocytidyl-2C-methyl-D-erythritol kinase
LYAVLILPERGLATGPVFEAFDVSHREVQAEPINWSQWAGMPASELNNVLINDLEPAAFHLAPWLMEIRAQAAAAIGRKVHMTGSGSTLFSLCSSGQEAGETAAVIAGVLPATATCVPVRILESGNVGTLEYQYHAGD